MAFTYRPLVDADLPLLHGWLNDQAVAQWWEDDDLSWEGVVNDYSEATRETEEHFIALLDGRPIGWIQCGEVSVWEEESVAWLAAGVDPSIGGIDYLLGTAQDRDLARRDQRV